MDIAKLKQLAEAATPGPWDNHCGYLVRAIFGDYAAPISVLETPYRPGAKTDRVMQEQYRNADFIAAANPTAVLELIAELERLRAIVDSVSAVNLMRLQGENERLRKIDTAARNLLDQRGRHNTEIAYRRLEAAVKGE